METAPVNPDSAAELELWAELLPKHITQNGGVHYEAMAREWNERCGKGAGVRLKQAHHLQSHHTAVLTTASAAAAMGGPQLLPGAASGIGAATLPLGAFMQVRVCSATIAGLPM